MNNESKNKKESRGLPFFGIGRVMPYLGKYRRTLIIMIVCGLCGSLVDIILPLFHQYALDHFVTGGVLDTLAVFIVLYVASVIFAGVVNYAAMSRATATEVSINRDLRAKAFPICRPCPSPTSTRTASATSTRG